MDFSYKNRGRCKYIVPFLSVVTLLLMSACGGGGGGSNPSTNATTDTTGGQSSNEPTTSVRALASGIPKALLPSFSAPRATLQVSAILDKGTASEKQVPLTEVQITNGSSIVIGNIPVADFTAASTVAIAYSLDDVEFGLVLVAQTQDVVIPPAGTDGKLDLKNPVVSFPDADGDLFTNLVELQQGANPNDSASTPPPPPPTNVAVSLSATGANITWDAVAGAQSYDVYTAIVANPPTIGGISDWSYNQTTTPSLTLDAVTTANASDVFVTVSAVNPVGQSVASVEASLKTRVNQEAIFGAKLTTAVVSPLALTNTTPIDQAVNVAANTLIAASFSNPPSGVTIRDVRLRLSGNIPVQGTQSNKPTSVTFMPASPLESGMNYTASLTIWMEDKSGNVSSSEKNWTFTTEQVNALAAPPLFRSLTPCCGSGTFTPTTTTIDVVFNEPIDPTPFLANTTAFQIRDDVTGAILPSTISVNGDTVTLTPNAPLLEDTIYRVSFSASVVTDLAGNAFVCTQCSLPGLILWNFRTAFQVPVIDVTNNLPIQGSVTVNPNVPTDYMVTGLAPGVSYNVSMTALSADADLAVYSDNFITRVCNSVRSGNMDESCIVAANAQGELYIRALPFNIGATFTLDVTISGVPPQPVQDITNSLPGFVGTVTAPTPNDYLVTGLTAGAEYVVDVTNPSADVDLSVYSDSFVTQVCNSSAGGLSNESCIVIANGQGTLYIRATHFNPSGSATFTLDVVRSAPPSSVQDITNLLPFGGSVTTTNSDYFVGGLIAGAGYEISMTTLSADVDLQVYTDLFMSLACQSANSGITSDRCIATANNQGELYIRANPYGSIGSATFTLDVVSVTPSPQPVQDITTLLPGFGGSVTATISSDYLVRGLVAGAEYEVVMTALTADVDLQVYRDLFVSLVCQSNNGNTTNDRCFATANGQGELYIRAYPFNVTGSATFTLDVFTASAPLPPPPPVVQDITSFNPGYSGSVASSAEPSQYVIRGLLPSTSYLVSVTDQVADVDLTVFSDAFSTVTCSSTRGSTVNDECVATANGIGELYIGVNLFSGQNGATFTLSASRDITGQTPLTTGVTSVGEFYTLGSFAPGQTVTVSITNLGGDIDLEVYSDPSFFMLACNSQAGGTVADSCATTADANGRVYVNVYPFGAPVGSSYTLNAN